MAAGPSICAGWCHRGELLPRRVLVDNTAPATLQALQLDMVERDKNSRDQPAYPLAEAARYLRLPAPTLRSWVLGRSYPKAGGLEQFQPLIPLAQEKPPALSFYNLVEAHVLHSLRSTHGVEIKEVRKAIAYAESQLNIQRLLLHQELRTGAGQLFLEKYGELINLNRSGQIAMRKLFEGYLERVQWDEWQFPVRLYPFVVGESPAARTIAIDPAVAFGRPVVARTRVSTATIVERLDAGETPEELAEDYGLKPEEIEEAVIYERAA